MPNKKIFIIGILSLILISSFVSSYSVAGNYIPSSGNYQSTSSTQFSIPTFQQFYSSQGVDYKQFWPVLDGSCDARGDFIVNIRPGGCSPAVVRSDLLEEQNVPVFCKMDAVKLNPIIDIASLKSVGFQVNSQDKYIAGISYHPSQIALRMYSKVLNSPLINDIGYSVVVLKKQVNESSMPDFVEANLTAVLTYDMREVFGAGQTNFFLPIVSEQEWNSEYQKYGFWKGRGYLRVDWIDANRAQIAVYNDFESIIRKLILTKGQVSDRIEIPGFYCTAAIRVQLNELASGKSRIRLQVDNNEFWLVEGEKFLDNCYVKTIRKIGAGGQATLRCFGKDYTLRVGISDKVSIKEGDTSKEINLGSVVDSVDRVYLAYIGQAKIDLNSQDNKEEMFIVLAKNPSRIETIDEVSSIKQEALSQIADNFNTWMREADSNKKSSEKWYQTERIRNNIANALGNSRDEVEIIFKDQKGTIAKVKDTSVFGNYWFIEPIGVKDKNYKLQSSASGTATDSVQVDILEDYFAETSKRAYELVNLHGSERDSLGDYYGAKVLSELAELASKIGKQKTQLGILRNLTEKYPSSSYAKAAEYDIEQLATFNYEQASSLVTEGTEIHYLKLQQVIEPGLDEASAVFSIQRKEGSSSSSSASSGSSASTSSNLLRTLEFSKSGLMSQVFRYKDKDYILGITFSSSTDNEINVEIDSFSGASVVKKIEKMQANSKANIDVDGDKREDITISVDSIGIESAKLTINSISTTTSTTTSPTSTSTTTSGKSLADMNRVTIQLNEAWYIEKVDSAEESIKVLELEEERIRLEYRHRLKTDDRTPTTEQVYLKKGETVTFRTYKDNKEDKVISLNLDSINLKKLAQVSLISEMPDGISRANFSVKIGIEKRGIELNPDKTKDRIENLNQSIKDFSKIVEDLGKVVKVWKGACFATSGLLIVKNLFTNMGGRSLAREEVMKNYWKGHCATEASEKGIKVEQCYAEHNSEIEKSVDTYASGISDANNLATSLKGANAEETQKNYVAAFKQYVKTNAGQQIKINGQMNSLGEVFGGVDKSGATIDRMVKNGDLRVEEMRNIMLDSKLVSSNSEIGNKLLERDIAPVYNVAKREFIASGASVGVQSSLGADVLAIGDAKKIGKTEIVPVSKLTQEQSNKINSGLGDIGTDNANAGDNFIVVTTYAGTIIPSGKGTKDYSNKVLYVPLEKKGNTYSLASKAGYTLDNDGKVADVVPKEDMNQIMSKIGVANFAELNPGLCNNKYLNPKVKFYETEPYKGMPAVVPLDLNKGWYTATKQIIPGFGMTPYKASGQASSLWICNVGANGREEFDIINDDICIQVNYDTGQPQGQLMCLSEAEGRRLANLAKTAVESAASQYKQASGGRVKINIPGVGSFTAEKAVSSVGTECTDFMSPSDCNLMFNVCDPVLCPSSRCNLGGSFQVDDVVQSGIIGSIALCLPNFGSPSQGGVIVPVCLTGIYAGLDSYVSILKAHKQCLEENLATGKFTGICDEIYSIYLCEFFWRQGAPLLDMALPKIVEMLYTGGRTRGGGEYMTVTHAWDTAQSSLSYFTNYYAVNAMKAFKARSTSEVGTEICKAFISTNYPSSKDSLDKLLEPESPVQFYAKFDEIAYSDATLPSTSQYKVYYHIFAGREQGHYYQVYLKNPPETAYYSSQPYIHVDAGYIGIGQSADQTKDFTAPAGYKELCVRIDSQDECGFKQVTTSFAVDYLKDMYMKEQGSEAITSEKTCVSGTTSLYSLANPNIQEAGQEMLQPAIYKRGLIRVCATNNPGNATDIGRWKDVGYCSDTRIRCWLDSISVENVIQDKNLEKETLKTAEELMNKEALDKGDLYTEDVSNSRLKEAWDLFKKILWGSINDINHFKNLITRNQQNNWETNIKDVFSLITTSNELSQKAFFNNQKVDAMYLGFEVYSKLSSKLAEVLKISSDSGVSSGGSSISPAVNTPVQVASTGFELQGNEIYYQGKNTGWKIIEASDGYVIRDSNNVRLGHILNGIISFDGVDSSLKTDIMKELEKNWILQAGKFVKKTITPTTVPVLNEVKFLVNDLDALSNQNKYTINQNENLKLSIKSSNCATITLRIKNDNDQTLAFSQTYTPQNENEKLIDLTDKITSPGKYTASVECNKDDVTVNKNSNQLTVEKSYQGNI